MFQINQLMIHHWKAIDFEITDFEYHHESACCRVSGAASNIGERRYELKASEPVSERNE